MPEQDERLSAALHEYYGQLAQQPAPDVSASVMMNTDLRTRRIRRWSAVGGGLLAAAAVAAVIVIALANHKPAASIGPAHSPTSLPTSTAVPTPATTPLPAVAAGPPVRGFVPRDVTAVSANQWWVLGYNGPTCASSACQRILHTTDGGKTFASVPVPPIAPQEGDQSAVRLRFADPDNGWDVSAAGVVWATHDGGAHWNQDSAAGSVTDLEASGGFVYAIACANSNCVVERSLTGQDSWSTLPATAGYGLLRSLAVNGAHLWVAPGSPGGGPGLLLASTDGGHTFSTHTACPSALAFGSVYVVDSNVLWVTCATGMNASAYRSVDGGQHFMRLGGSLLLPNFASIAGVSSTTAVIGGVSLQRTEDGGQTFTTVEANQTQWTIVGFTTSVNGFAFESLQLHGQLALWRTNDAGAHWYQVQFP
jgi:photosystem II stability/assembly factor-like uncharacterized protein